MPTAHSSTFVGDVRGRVLDRLWSVALALRHGRRSDLGDDASPLARCAVLLSRIEAEDGTGPPPAWSRGPGAELYTAALRYGRARVGPGAPVTETEESRLLLELIGCALTVAAEEI